MTGKVDRPFGSRAPAAAVVLALCALGCALLLSTATAGAAGKAFKPGAPTVATGSVKVQGASTTLLGAISPRGEVTTYYFKYGPTITYGKQTTPATLPAGTTRVKVGQAAKGLLAGYHYRLVASNALGLREGKDRTFSTVKSRKSKLTLNKHAEATVYGGALDLDGLLSGTGNAAKALVLQESPYPFLTPFATVGTSVLTNASGGFTFRVPRLLLSTQFRVSTLDPRPLYSPTLTVRASYKVTLKVRTSGHPGLVRLYGTVTPAAVGARVSFQLRKPARPGKSEKASERTTKFATQFTTTAKRGTKTVSRFSAIVKVLKGGRYQARVDPSKKGAFVAGSSATVLLHSAR
ncbi:MAG TPA: hypothetical protein VGH21_03205 [Solirubrobacteraceae bacterium]